MLKALCEFFGECCGITKPQLHDQQQPEKKQEHKQSPKKMDEKESESLNKAVDEVFAWFGISDSESEGGNATTVIGSNNNLTVDNAGNATDN